ncbi:MAG: hypothetical protein WBP59_12930 [Ilumatobacteraceae bacterium]
MTTAPTQPSLPTVSGDVGATLRALHDQGELELPLPGRGDTAHRHMRLFELARSHDVSVARLAEAHTDAVAILLEAGHTPRSGELYGVWASAPIPNHAPLRGELRRRAADRLELTADKPFASGLGVVDRALVTASCDPIAPVEPSATHATASSMLVDVDVRPSASVSFDTGRWTTEALRESATGSVRFTDHPLAPEDVVRGPNWYLDRVGFWHGACGPAACWAGAAVGLVDAAELATDDNPHRRAHLGALRAHAWSLAAVLRAAGDEIDRDPADVERAHRRALALRHTVERAVDDVLDRVGRSLGPRPFVGDAQVAQRWADTHLYVRQHHAERDLESLGRGPAFPEPPHG